MRTSVLFNRITSGFFGFVHADADFTLDLGAARVNSLAVLPRQDLIQASALSSVVEHYLHTVAGNHDLAKFQRSNGENSTLRPNLGAKMPRTSRRFTRIARGLYRYGGTGQIYLCRKVSGRNRRLNLQTTHREVAIMAIAAVTSYAQTQNGDHQVAVVDDALAKTPVAIIDGQVRPLPLLPISSPTAATPESQTPIPARRSMTIRALIEELKSQWKHLAASTQKIRDTYFNVLVEHLDADADVSTVLATPSGWVYVTSADRAAS
jgi:hypothetical protein